MFPNYEMSDTNMADYKVNYNGESIWLYFLCTEY